MKKYLTNKSKPVEIHGRKAQKWCITTMSDVVEKRENGFVV